MTKKAITMLLLLAGTGVALAQNGSREVRRDEVSVSSGTPQTQPNRRAPNGERWVARLDQDGDGKVSPEEFDGPEEHFTRLDRDGDGYLAANEAPPPRRGPRPGPPGGPMGQQDEAAGSSRGGDAAEGKPSFVARLDQDGDGQVSAEEFDGPPEHFDHFDQDQNGFISEDEAPKGPPPPSRRPPRQED